MNFENDVKKALELCKIKNVKLETPSNPDFGDLAFACFDLAKELKKNPVEIAKDIAKKIKPNKSIAKVNAVGPYVNFSVNFDLLANYIIRASMKKSFGAEKKKKENVMVEYSQPNTHKAFHVGHVRSTGIGDSIANVLELAGYKVLRANYMGDTGAHVAKCLWCYLKFHKNDEPGKEKGAWLGKIYAEANRKIKENVEYEKEVQNLLLKLDKREDKTLMKLWEKTRQWSLDDFEKIYREIGSKFDYYFFESQLEGRSKEIVKELLKKGIVEVSQGATIINLEKYGLGVFVLLRADGTPLYSAKDLALAELKFNKYKIDNSIYVVAAEQTMHFKQLFKTLELSGFKKVKKCVHIPFELVILPTGKMSTREGTGINYIDLRDKMMASVLPKVKEKHPKLLEKEQEIAALQIVVGAIKYPMIKISNTKVVVFDWEQALSLEGETAPYIQYTYVRAKRILEKVGEPKKTELTFASQEEINLIKSMALFPEIIRKVAENYDIHTIAKYAFDLATLFNLFYEKHSVMHEKDQTMRNSRLMLIKSYTSLIRTVLDTLGIETPEFM